MSYKRHCMSKWERIYTEPTMNKMMPMRIDREPIAETGKTRVNDNAEISFRNNISGKASKDK